MDDPMFYGVLFVLGALGIFLRTRIKKRPTAVLSHADGSACTGSACHNIEHATQV